MVRAGTIGFGAAAKGYARGFVEAGASVAVFCDGPNNRPPYGREFRRDVEALGGRTVDSLAALAAEADAIFFAAPYTAAISTAQAIAPSLRPQTLYADISNAPPPVKREAAAALEGTGALYVDVGVLGEIGSAGLRAEVVVAGPGATAFCDRMKPFGVRAEKVGDEAGQAALLKMLANVFTKGLAALAFEMLIPAERLGLTEHAYAHVLRTLDAKPLSQFVVERMLAPMIHAARRGEEMAAVVSELETLGFDPVVTRATRDVHRHLAALGTGRRSTAGSQGRLARSAARRLGARGEGVKITAVRVMMLSVVIPEERRWRSDYGVVWKNDARPWSWSRPTMGSPASAPRKERRPPSGRSSRALRRF